jgi:hypothetical protein
VVCRFARVDFLGFSYDLINRSARNTPKTLEKTAAALDLIDTLPPRALGRWPLSFSGYNRHAAGTEARQKSEGTGSKNLLDPSELRRLWRRAFFSGFALRAAPESARQKWLRRRWDGMARRSLRRPRPLVAAGSRRGWEGPDRTKRHAQKRSLKSSHKGIFYTNNKTNKKRITKREANEPTKNDGKKRRKEKQGNRQATSNPRRLQRANATAPTKQERQTTTESKQETTLRGAQPPEHEHRYNEPHNTLIDPSTSPYLTPSHIKCPSLFHQLRQATFVASVGALHFPGTVLAFHRGSGDRRAQSANLCGRGLRGHHLH